MAILLGIGSLVGKEQDQAAYEKAMKSANDVLDLAFYNIGDK